MRRIALVAAACFVCAPASAASTSTKVDPGEGTLATRDGKDIVPVPLEHTQVAIHVAANLARVDVEQTFHNPYKNKIEATYLFPLPTGAAVNAMEITTGGKTIAGQIMQKADAQATYAVAKQEGHVAALLTEQRPNLFTQAVANIEPGERVVVKLHYVEPLPYAEGDHEVVFPMVAPPRYVPPASKLRPEEIAAIQAPVLPAGLRSGHDIGVSVDIDPGAGVTLGAIESPSHHIETKGTHVVIGADDTVPNKDFILRWRVAGAEPSFAVVADRQGDSRGSFFLVAEPPLADAVSAPTPRELVFVVDTSSSMAGQPLAKAKQIVHRALAGMQPDDTFQIVRFDDSASALGKAMIANKAKNVEIAGAWLDALDASGGTDLATGITAGLDLPHDRARLRIVVFLTDGYVGNEDEILKLVADKRGDARFFPVGIGSAVNRYLLEEMAATGRGALQVIRPDEDTAVAVEQFYRRIDRPVLTDLHVDWHGLAVEDVTPSELPDLFVGQPLVVSGRYARAGATTVTVTGMSGGRPVSFQVPVNLPEKGERPEVGTVWARARIAELSRQQIRGERPETTAQIVGLALANHLLTPYTAFVAVDTARTTKAGKLETVPVPVEVPDGVNRGGGGGGGYGYGAIGMGAGGGGSGVGYAQGAVLGSVSGVTHGEAMGAVMAKVAVEDMPVEEFRVPEKAAVSAPMVTIPKAPEPSPPSPQPPATPSDGDDREGKMGHHEGQYAMRADVDAPHRAAIDKCYKAAVARTPGMSGRLTLHLVIDDKGKLTRFEIRELPAAADDAMRDCVSTAVAAWTWPAAAARDTEFELPLGSL